MYFFVRFLLFIKKVKDIKKKKKKTTIRCLRFEWGDGERSQVAGEESGTSCGDTFPCHQLCPQQACACGSGYGDLVMSP